MKTVRQNTFETNSSSTHSVTICSKRTPNNKPSIPLVEDGCVYPDRLGQFETEIGYEGSSLVCIQPKRKQHYSMHGWKNCLIMVVLNLKIWYQF